jgi:putative PEP-CTERM system histidine kinase
VERLIVDLCSVLGVAAAAAVCARVVSARPRAAWLWPLAAGFIALALWAITVSAYVHAPFSAFRVRVLLLTLCVVLGPWMLFVLTLCARPPMRALSQWKGLILAQGAGYGLAGAIIWRHGVDWITGIGSEPTVVLTWWGLVALAVSSVPGWVVLAVFVLRVGSDVADMPAVWISAAGVASSVLFASLSIFWHGYLDLNRLVSVDVLGTVAAMVGAASIVRTLPGGRPFLPSRRVVYGAAAVGLVAAYLLVARFVLGWAVDWAAGAVPEILPAAGFAAIAGLLMCLGSRRTRHRLWVTIGRHLFRSKHDYGEVWTHLTELVSQARDARDLVQRAVAYCRDVLCVSEVSVWLNDAAGRFSRVALATDDRGSIEHVAANRGVPPANRSFAVAGTDGTREADEFAAIVGGSCACSMRANERLLGFLVVAPAKEVELDAEDRRLLRYISAQLASALGLYRLGEEIADAREVSSFHRVSAFVLHDLKNLVAQQSMVLENAAQFWSDPAFVTDALAAFKDSTRRMRSLISRLRSRGTTEPSLTGPTDVRELLCEMVAAPGAAMRSDCTIRLVVPDGTQACPVPIDRGALAQVFSNLLVNAVESLPSEAGEVVVTIAQGAGMWSIEVRDNGCGIPETFLRDDVFRPFRTTKETGSGIGLYQCKTIVEATGGTISLTSEKGVGTSVTVTFPQWSPDKNGFAAEVRHGEACSAGH